MFILSSCWIPPFQYGFDLINNHNWLAHSFLSPAYILGYLPYGLYPNYEQKISGKCTFHHMTNV